MNKLDALKARVAAATQGPWETDKDDGPHTIIAAGKRTGYFIDPRPTDEAAAQCIANAEFTAHAREDIEQLVAVLQLLADYSPLHILPWEQQRRDALAYWLEGAE